MLGQHAGPQRHCGFYTGYNPTRIIPGDKLRRLPNNKKAASGSIPEIADFVDAVYRAIITAGTHKAASIKVTEAAKVIENTRRDLKLGWIPKTNFDELAIELVREGLKAAERDSPIKYHGYDAMDYHE